jgi:hypothetical protein
MPGTSITKIEKQEALLLAQELLSQAQVPDVVRRALKSAYPRMSATMVARTVREAQRLVLATIDESVEQLRGKVVARSDALYRRALRDGKLTVCVELLKLQSKVYGIERPTEVRHSGAVVVRDDFDDRSEADLRFFLDHGCFPEEAPKH